MNRKACLAIVSAVLLAGCAQQQAPAGAASPDLAANPTAVIADSGTTAEAALAAAEDGPSAGPADTGAGVDQAIDNMLGDHLAYRRVIDELQRAVAAKDAAAVAALVQYPIGVQIEGKNTVLKDAAAFTARYDQFMTPDIAKAITDTRYAEVLVNYKGVMLGRGEAWINGICKDSACKDVDVRVVTLQSTADLSP